jgi:hypothetical protein
MVVGIGTFGVSLAQTAGIVLTTKGFVVGERRYVKRSGDLSVQPQVTRSSTGLSISGSF